MHNRIKLIRKENGMTRAEFGEKLGITADMVNNMERGRTEIREDRIKLICATFLIREEWLRTGEGEKKEPLTENQEISDFMNEVMELPDENTKKRFIRSLAKLNERDWQTIEKILDFLAGGD